MGANLWHCEVAAGPRYKRTERELPIAEHMIYDRRRSKQTHDRAFRRYLAMLRGLHLDSHSTTFVEIEYDGEACLVCSQKSTVMENIFHRRSGSMFVLGSTPHHITNDIMVEIDCDYKLQKLMMCGKCHGKWIADIGSGSECSLDSTQAETILRRFWKQHSYPVVRSVLRG